MTEEPPGAADRQRQHLNRITDAIIGCAYTVANSLGHGFLEKVYENALAYELRRRVCRSPSSPH